jgi:hypothetical protein
MVSSFADALAKAVKVYEGSDGNATKNLYNELEALGTLGVIAVNVFRAHKTSGAAKRYRGRGNRDAAYDRKRWSLGNLASALVVHAEHHGLTWGWKEDPEQIYHRWVIYVDLPTGQVSYHTTLRGDGPDYAGEWDGIRMAGPDRICRFVAHLLSAAPATQPEDVTHG